MSEGNRSLEKARRITFKWRFAYLFITILVLMGLEPVQMKIGYLDILLDIIFTAVLIAAINVVSFNKKQTVIGLILAVPAFISTWATSFSSQPWLLLTASFSGVAFFLFLSLAIFIFVINQEYISRDLMSGAAVVYLLLAIMWAFVYRGIDTIQPGSFFISEHDNIEQGFPYMYFSIVTITTLGYGDIHPVSYASRTAASLQALIGQIYLVFTVARLVGIHTSQSLEKKKRSYDQGDTGQEDRTLPPE